MSLARLLLALLLVIGWLGACVVFVSKAEHALHDSPDQSLDHSPDAPGSTWRPYGTTTRALPGASATNDDAPTATPDDRGPLDRDPFGRSGRRVLLVAGVAIAGGLLVVGVLLAALGARWAADAQAPRLRAL